MPLSATTYYFDSKEELLEQTLLLAAREETERIERLVLDLAPLVARRADWAARGGGRDRLRHPRRARRHVALFELGLEATRTEALRASSQRWQEAHIRLAEMGCRAVGSDEPELDARIVVAALTGLMLEQLASGRARLRGRGPAPGARAAVRAPRGRRSRRSGVASRQVAERRESIAYREAGPPDARAVLLLHGYPESSFMWRDAPRRRSPRRAGARVAPDLPGFGDSPPDPPGTWERHVERARALPSRARPRALRARGARLGRR